MGKSPHSPMQSARLQLRDWSNVHADLAWIYEGAVDPKHRDAPCRPSYLGAWLILAGKAALTQDGRTVEARPGEWLVIRQATGHQRFSDDARILSIRFTAEWPDRRPFYDEGLSAVLAADHFPALAAAGRALLPIARQHLSSNPMLLRDRAMSFAEFVTLRQGFWAWMLELQKALSAIGVEPTRTLLKDERIVKALHELDRLPFSARLREAELAKIVGLQVGHFVRTFRAQVGTTPKRYFDMRRRTVCRRLLVGTNTAIKVIAADLGFRRLSDFSAWFHAVEGMSPREFRQAHQDCESPI